jgi:shikimate kinase
MSMRELNLRMEKRNIILVGFMGTGKSTVGKRLAKVLGWSFVDTDAEIGDVTGLNISEIFRRHGETRFRSEERLVVKRLKEREHCIIATGGGTVLDPQNWEDLSKTGVMITLYAPLDEIYERIGHRSDRPLLKGSREEVQKLWEERQPIYGKADWILDTTDKGIDEVVVEIIQGIEGGLTFERAQN